jgi:hypothetical protein
VHPALFWLFGRRAAERHLHDSDEADELDDPLPARLLAHDSGFPAHPTFKDAPTGGEVAASR